MRLKDFKALMSLATEQGIELTTARELKRFAFDNRDIISNIKDKR